MKVYVLRHGLTEFNKKGIFNGAIDESLSEEGIEQTKALQSLLPKNIKKIYSSSLKRAVETAEIINLELNAAISFHDELKEVNAGTHNGTVFSDEIKKKHRSLKYDWRSDGGESVENVRERTLKIFNEINKSKIDGEVLVVTHGGIIRILNFLEHGTLLGDIDNLSLQTFDLDKIIGVRN